MSQAGCQGVTFQAEGTRPPVLSLAVQIVGSGRELPLRLQRGLAELGGGIRATGSELGCSVFVSLGKVHPSGEVLSVTVALQLSSCGPLWEIPSPPGPPGVHLRGGGAQPAQVSAAPAPTHPPCSPLPVPLPRGGCPSPVPPSGSFPSLASCYCQAPGSFCLNPAG